MPKKSIFEQSLDALKPRAAALVEELRSLDCESVVFCSTRQGQKNLKILGDFQKTLYLHSNYDAFIETQRWIESIALKKETQLLYCFGIGLGYIYSHIKDWLHQDAGHYLVILEDDLRVLARLAETALGLEIFSDRQVRFLNVGSKVVGGAVSDETVMEFVCEDIAHYFMNLRFQVTALPIYEQLYEDRFLKLKTLIAHKSIYATFTAIELNNYGTVFFGGYYHNMIYLPASHEGSKLYKQFESVPAIICGAGPSLQPQFKLLKELRDRALFFAGGSAIKALTSNGITPHFGGSVDPNEPQFDRMVEHEAYELPMFYVARALHAAFRTFHGPRIFLPTNNVYPISLWLENRLGLNTKHPSSGLNVVHILLNNAILMGCNPIIFVGMDLGFTGMRQYADGVIENNSCSLEEITKRTDLNNNAILRKDIHGKPFYTLWKWIAESDYTSKRMKSVRDSCLMINATEGGLGFEGMENKTLQDVADKYLKKPLDLENRVHAALQSAPLSYMTKDFVLRVYREIYDSLGDAEKLCDDMLRELESLKSASRSRHQSGMKKSLQGLEECQKKLKETIAYRHILSPLNIARSHVYARLFDQIEFDSVLKSETERVVTRIETNIEETRFIQKSAQVNKNMLETCVKRFGELGYATEAFEKPEKSSYYQREVTL